MCTAERKKASFSYQRHNLTFKSPQGLIVYAYTLLTSCRNPLIFLDFFAPKC